MSELIDKLRVEFQDEEYRHAYTEECLNTMIATQIRVLREQRDMTQTALANKTGMLQPRLSVLEDASYSSWSINTLKRFARAFDLTLKVSFESFTTFILDFESLGRETLQRASFNKDPLFRSNRVVTSARFRKKGPSRMDLAMLGQMTLFGGQVVSFPSSATQRKPQRVDVPANRLVTEQKGEIANAAIVGGNG